MQLFFGNIYSLQKGLMALARHYATSEKLCLSLDYFLSVR